jgi:hypothetical protein
MSILSVAVSRTKDLGRIGKFLFVRLKKEIIQEREYLTNTLASEVSTFRAWGELDRKDGQADYDRIKLAGWSMLFSRYPFQITCNERVVCVLIEEALAPLQDRLIYDNMVYKGGASPEWSLKGHAGARNKVNIYASEVLASIRAEYSHLCVEVESLLVRSVYEMYDDQAAAWLMFTAVLSKYVSSQPARLAYRAVMDPKGCKQLTTVLKALGLNSTQLGAVFCEAQCLQGRGVGEVDLMAEAGYRVSDSVTEKVVDVDETALRSAIRHILERELRGTEVEFEDPEVYWSRRWVWCVNGAHGRALEQHEAKWAVSTIEKRIHRKVFSENTKLNPVLEWSGVSYFSASQKLESGKSRALFAGDSATYVAFNHLLSPVEKAWRGERCILDPGKDGMAGMVRRVQRLRSGASVNVMLDYDDFNSQHTLRSMQIVFEELCALTRYPEALAAKIVKSFVRGRVFVGGVDMGYSKGTLMSGHRATSFINTVLNEAYIAVAAPMLYECKSMHVGDDVFIAAHDMAQAAALLDAIGKSEFRLNPMKQSVGVHTAEFLRLAMGETCARGYVCRSIAAVVCGNWVSEMKLGPLEGLQMMVRASWSLMARSGDQGAYNLLSRSCVRISRIKREHALALLSGRVALGDGPCLRAGTARRSLRVDQRLCDDDVDSKWQQSVRAYATEAYLSNHVTPVEASALAYVEMAPKKVMVNASYKKTLASRGVFGSVCEGVTVLGESMSELQGAITVEDALSVRPDKGVLSGYPLVQLARHGLKDSMLRNLVNMVGGDSQAIDIRREAFGSESRGVVVDGWLPYGDACTLGGRVVADVICVTYPIMM